MNRDNQTPDNDPQVIRSRSLRGIRWTTAQTMFVAVLGPISQVIKARFLSPGELGVVAVFMIVYGLLHTIENAGLGQSIVQKAELDGAERFTYLTITLIAGLVGGVVLSLLSGTVENLFRVDGSAKLIEFSGLLLFFALIDQYFRAILNRHLLFRGPAILETIKRLLNIVFLSVFFRLGLGPIGVVYAMLASTLIGATGLFAIAVRSRLIDLQPRLAMTAVQHLYGFGLPVAAKQIFTYVTHRADEVTIGLFLSSDALGIYHLAKETLQQLQSLITNSFSRVLLSLFSRIRGDKERLTRVYERISLVVSYVGIPVFIGVALTAESVVPAVFGSQWAEAVPAFQILAIALIPIVLTANLSSALLYSLGKSKAVLLTDILVNVPYLVVLVALASRGLRPVLYLYLAYCFAKGIALQVIANRELTMSGKYHSAIYFRVILRVLVMVVTIVVLQLIIGPEVATWMTASLLVTVGVLSMLGAVWFSDKAVLAELRMLFLPRSSNA